MECWSIVLLGEFDAFPFKQRFVLGECFKEVSF